MSEASILPPARKVARPGASPNARGHIARELVETIVLTAVIFFVVHISVQPFEVKGPSMEPGLFTGEYVMVNTLAYLFGGPQRGDVIVFHPPTNPSVTYVKRVIGIPGDRIDISLNAVFVDGIRLNEPYIYPLPSGVNENNSVFTDIRLGPGQYFVLGDHRQDSDDSRDFGYVPRANIVGKAEMVFWPLGDVHIISTYSQVFAHVSP
ncbi:MAG TPA: signal peptidase I [Ktedonobacterales bacterium]|nr:signal peptidase I [Ktedonobacterales bacterium]